MRCLYLPQSECIKMSEQIFVIKKLEIFITLMLKLRLLSQLTLFFSKPKLDFFSFISTIGFSLPIFPFTKHNEHVGCLYTIYKSQPASQHRNGGKEKADLFMSDLIKKSMLVVPWRESSYLWRLARCVMQVSQIIR